MGKMNQRKRSSVWMHFSISNEVSGKAKCNICQKVMSFRSGSTNNLHRHLKSKHRTVNLTEIRRERTDYSDNSDDEVSSHRATSTAEPVIQVSIISDELEQHERISNEETSRAVSDIVSEAFSLSVQPTKRRSAVWRYYEHKEDANKVLCLLCSENIHYRQNTSNLLRHLRKKHPDKNLDQGPHAFPDDCRSTGVPPGLMAPITLEPDRRALDPSGQMRRTLEQTEQMRRTMEQETRALERERELTEQLRRAQQQEARALEQQRELTEQLRRAQEEEMKRTRELEARALEQERHAIEQLRKTQEQEARAIEREREALEQLRKELEEDRKSLQRHWDAIRQGRVTVTTAGEEDCAIPGVVEAGEVEMLVVTS